MTTDFKTECSDELSCNCNIDWTAVDARIRAELRERGMTYEDICDCLGIDTKGNVFEQRKKLPKMKTAMRVATYLGVPAAWVLYGDKAQMRLDFAQRISGTKDSTVVQGNRADTLIINGNALDHVSAQKKELDRLWAGFSVKKQTKLLSIAYEMEDES